MMKQMFLLILLSGSFSAFSQPQLSSSSNRPIAGDAIARHQVTFSNPGDVGTGQLWDLRSLRYHSGDFELSYHPFWLIDSLGDRHLASDTLALRDGSTLYYHSLASSGVFLQGFENATTAMAYDVPEQLLCFPFAYGDSISGIFHGTGVFCEKLSLQTFGTYVMKADAVGTLILENGDTLRNVLRVSRSRKESLLSYPLDSLPSLRSRPFDKTMIATALTSSDHPASRSEVYQWYAPECRYPVLELRRLSHANSVACTAFYTSPSLQSQTLFAHNTPQRSLQAGCSSGDEICLKIRTTDDNAIRFDYTLSASTDCAARLYTTGGILIWEGTVSQKNSGPYVEEVCTAGLRKGVYLLELTVGDKRYAEKIILK